MLDRSGEHSKARGDGRTPYLWGHGTARPRLHKEHELEFYFALACVHFGRE
jgi:hypothetical protein